MIPFVTINLDKPRQLRLTMRAAIEIEQTFGIKVLDIVEKDLQEDTAKFAWILLKQEDKELTLEQTYDILDYADSLIELRNKILEAVLVGMKGDKKDEESPNGQAPAAKEELNS